MERKGLEEEGGRTLRKGFGWLLFFTNQPQLFQLFHSEIIFSIFDDDLLIRLYDQTSGKKVMKMKLLVILFLISNCFYKNSQRWGRVSVWLLFIVNKPQSFQLFHSKILFPTAIYTQTSVLNYHNLSALCILCFINITAKNCLRFLRSYLDKCFISLFQNHCSVPKPLQCLKPLQCSKTIAVF